MADYLNPEEERRRIAAENAARPVNPAWNGQVARNPFAAPAFEELYPEVSRLRDAGQEVPVSPAPAAEVVPEPPPAREDMSVEAPAEPLPAASPLERPFTPPDQRRAQLARVGAQLEYIETHMGPDVAGRYRGGTAARWRESLANAGDFLANADQETFDKFVPGLAEWAETRFAKAEKDRAIGEVARDAFVRSWEDTKALGRNLYNLGAYELGGRSREDFVAAAARENERAERLRISNPERVSGIEGIRSVGDFGWWALEGALSQSVNLLASVGAAALTGGASVGATVAAQTAAKAGAKAAAKAGVKAAVKGAVKTAVGSSVKGTAKSMAAQRIGALVGSQAAGAVLNAGDIAGQLADEAIARGEDPSVARLLAETAVYTGIDAGLGVVARNVRRLFPGASEEVVARRAMQEARKGFHADSRSFAGQMWSVAKSVAGDMLGEGAGEMLQTEATRVGNLLQYGTGLRQGEESWTDALLADVNEFAVAAVSAGVPGAAGNVRALASQRAEVEKANTAGRRVSSASVDEALRRKFESARLFERSARDAADSDAFDALGGFDKTLCNNALKLRVDVSHCDAWLRGRVSATEGERAEADRVRTAREAAAESLSRVREAMSPAGRAWLDAYTGLFDGDFGSFPADDPRFAPDFDVDAARRNFAAQDEDASRNGGIRAYTDGRGAGDAGRVQFFEKRDEGNNLVIEVRSLSGRAMPERTGNEFYAREFDGDENAARAAALDFASKLSGYERYIAWKDEQMRSYAQEFLDRNYVGKTAYILRVADDLPLRGVARDAQEAESMRERGMDVLHVLSDGERAEMLDKTMPDGFAAGTSGFHLGGVADSVFLLPRAAESPLEIAATLTHENFHADFAALAGTQRINLEEELGAAKVGEMPEREIAYRLKARLLGIKVGKNVLTQDAMDAIDQAEEALATRAESEDGGEELKTGLFHDLIEKHPKLGRLLGQFFEEKVGATPRNEAEIADFIFRVTEFGKGENAGAENFAVIGKLVPRDADADEGSFRAAMRLLNPAPENAAPNDINLVPGEEGEGGFANPEADEETERGVALSGELSRRRDAARDRETADRAEAERKAREKAANKRQGDERAKAIAARKKVEAEFAAREKAEREASERKAREEREERDARKKSIELARRNERVGKIYGKFLEFIDRYRPDVGDDEAFMRAHEAEFSRLEKALQEVNPQEVFEAANDIREAIRKENRKDRTSLSSEEKEAERTVAANEALDRREAAEFADEEAEWKRLAEYVKQGEEREEAERQDERADAARTAETVEAGEARDEAERQKAKDADEKLRREAPWSLGRESDSMLEADERLAVARAAKATAARNVEKAKSAHRGGEAKSERVQRAEKALGQAEKNLAKAERGQRDAYAAPEKRRRSMSFWNNRPVLSEQDAADRRVARRLDAARRSAFAANLARGLPRNVAWARAQVVKLPDATPDATKRWTVANADPTSFPVSAAIGVHGTLLGEVTPNSELWEYVSDMTPAQARAAGLAEMKVELRGKSIRPGETGADAVRRLTDPEGVSPSGRGWASAFPTGHAADSVVERLAEDLAANGYRIAPDAKESDVVEDLVARLSDERARIDDMVSRGVSSLSEDEADRQEVRRSRSEWGVSEDGANLDAVRDEVERRIWSAARDEAPDLSFLGEEWAAATPDQRREWLDQEAAAQEAIEDAIAKGDEELRRNREAAESVRQSDAGERPVEESGYPDIDELDGGIHFRSSASFFGEALSRESARVLDALRPLLGGLRVIVSRDPAEAARRERRRLGVAPSGRNKQSGAEYPDAAGEIASLRFAVGKKRRVAYGDVLAKSRPDLDAESVLKELDKFDDPKKEKIALHWIVRGGLVLPEDAYKVDDALSVAEKAKVDPFLYKSPDELLLAHKEFKPITRPIDPATVPELSAPRDEGDGIVSYEVQDDRQGQAAMRRVIDTHWGEDANPWCLLARNARDPDRLDSSSQINWGKVNDWFYSLPVEKRREITKDAYDPDDDSVPHPYTKSRDYLVSEAYFNENAGARDEMALENAWNYWQQYSALPKRVAFKDGRLLAFMATEEPDIQNNDSLWDAYDAYREAEEADGGVASDFEDWVRESGNTPKVAEEWWDRQDESHSDLDWAREDGGVRESRKNKKTSPRHRAEIAKRGATLQPTDGASNRRPVQVDPGAGQRLASLAENLAQHGEKNPAVFLHRLIKALGNVSNLNPDHSEYFVTAPNGVQARMRLADHQGNAYMFGARGELSGNTGVVIKLSDHRFVASPDVEYREFVFFPENLTDQIEAEIALGLKDWAKTGHYTGPVGDKVNISPRPVSIPRSASISEQEQRDSNNQTIGVYDAATGDVFLSPDATPETVAHEILGHAVWNWSRESAPELHEKMRQFATKASRAVRDYVMRNYPELDRDGEAFLDELCARALEEDPEIGKMLKTAAEKSWWRRVLDVVKSLWRRFRGANGMGRYAALAPKAAMRQMAKDALAGRTFGEAPAASPNGAAREARTEVLPDALSAHMEAVGVPEEGREQAMRLVQGQLFAIDEMSKDGYVYPGTPEAAAAEPRKKISMKKPVAPPPVYTSEEKTRAFRALEGGKWADRADWALAQKMLDEGLTVSSVMPELWGGEKLSWPIRGFRIAKPADVAALAQSIRSPYQESVKAVFLDRRGVALDARIVSLGALSMTLGDPLTMLSGAPDGTVGVVLSHNHPSGDPTPSPQDEMLTRAVSDACQTLGYKLVDHVVTNGTRYYSFRSDSSFHDVFGGVFADGSAYGFRGRLRVGENAAPEFVPGKAPWEAVAADERQELVFPAITFEVAEDFRSDDEDSAFVVHLDHRLKLVAVSKIKPEELAADDFISRLSRKVVAERASDLWMLFCGSAPVDVAGLLEQDVSKKLHKPLEDVIYPEDGAAYGHASLAYNYKDKTGWTNDAISAARTMGLTKDAAKKWLAKRKAPPPMQGNATPADGDIHFRSASSIAPSAVAGARTRDAEARANAILPGGYSWHPEHRKRQEMAEQAIALMDSDPEISARVRAKLLAPAADGRQPEALNSDEMEVAFILLRQSERAVVAAQDAARAAKRNGEDVATVRLAEAAAAAAEGVHAKLVEGYNRSGSTASAAMNIRQVAYDAATDTFAGRMSDLEKSMDEARSAGRLRTGASVSAGARGRIIGGVRRLQKLVSALRLAEKNAEDENVKKLLSDILAVDAAEAKRTAARGAASKMPVLSREELVEEGKARYQTLMDRRGAPFNPANPADRLDLHSLVRWIGRELTRADVAAGRPIASADAFRSDLAAVCREIITPFASLDDRAWADIFSNYGIIREADTEEVARRMNQLTELERLVSQLQDIEKKQLPRRSGQQRTESSVEAEELQKKINRLLKDAGLSVPEGEDPKRFRKNALQIVKDGMRRQMALLQKAIDEKKPVELNRDPVLYDEEATDLKTQLEALRAQYHEMFDVELTDAERVKKLLDFYAKREQKALEALEKARKGEFRGPKEPTRDAWLRENDLRVQVAAQRLADIREEMHALENAAGEEAWMSDYSVAVRRALASRERSLRRYREFRADPDLWFNRNLRRKMLDVSGAKEVVEAQKKVDAERAEWEKMKQDIILDNMNLPAKTWESVKALKDVSKRTLASLDLSGIYVQCAVAMIRKNPRYAAKTIRQGVRALFSDKSAGEYMDELHKDPRWRLVTEKMGVRISEYDPNGAGEMEEMRASTRLAQRWMEKAEKTIGGKAYNALMAASDRGFTVPVNMIRFAYATELAELAHKAKGKDLTDDELRQLGRVVNMQTGRGDFFGNPEMSAALAKVFWAPAKWSGQIQTLLLPLSVATHGELDPKVRREIVRRAWMQPLAGYALYATMFYILRCLLKGEDDDEKGDFIEANPLNPMFGRPNIGGQRFSLTGGLESYITFAARMATGKTQNPAGKTTEVQKRSDLVWRQIKNKSTPEIGTILQFLDRTTIDGRKIVKGVTPIGGRTDAVTGQREIGTVNFLVGNSVLPLTARDIRDLITKGDTNVGQTALLAALAFLGANSQDYGFDPFEAAEARFLAAEKAWFSKNPVSGRFDYGKVKPMTDIERRSLLAGELGPYIQAHGEGRATLDRIREIDNTLKNGWKLGKGRRRSVTDAEKEQLLLLRDQLKLSFRAIWNPELRQTAASENGM